MAVLDLTKGYYQAPLDKNSRKYTAFITPDGTYQWARVPMGLKTSGAFFQRAVATEVLGDLLYASCFLYIDDIIIFGSTKEEYLNNLHKVLTKFDEHNVLINPKKCKFNLQQVNYLGHTIDQDGVHFAPEKLRQVVDFAKPNTHKEMKSFLGLVNYFRDHLDHVGEPLAILHKMVNNYHPRHKLAWTDKEETAFNAVKDKVNTCPKLFFMDEHSPIHLHTDASDYGIGAFLFQQRENTRVPIAFVSKSLSEQQQRWSTYEKECYAIIYAINKLDYLLRDKHFNLKTDHKNLTYMNTSTSAKVLRWKLFLQEFNFNLKYIKGSENGEADALSRIRTPNHNTLTKRQRISKIIAAQHVQHRTQIEQPPLNNDTYNNISKCHNAIMGHHGVQRTLKKVAEANYTNVTKENVKQFVRQCEACQLMSQIKPAIQATPFTTATYLPMQRIAIDTMGPFSQDSEHPYIIVIIDCFTRYIHLYPTKNVEATTAANKLLHWVCNYGVPDEILHDKGSQYHNELFEEFTSIMDIKNLEAMQYSKEENTLVERANKEVLKHLRILFYNNEVKSNLPLFAPLVQRIYNAAPHSAIGVAPATALYGNAVHLDRHLINKDVSTPNLTNQSWQQYMHELIVGQQQIFKSAQILQNKKDKAHLHTTQTITEFPHGSYVLVKAANPSQAPKKGEPELMGPYIVVNNVGNKYTLQNLVTLKTQDFHVVNLRKFHFDPSRTDPEAVAKKATNFADVGKILQHRGRINKKSSVEFLVRWEGYGPIDDSWLHWDHLIHNEAMHTYLNENKMRSHIPIQYRNNYARISH